MKRILTLAGVGLLGLGTLAACSEKIDRKGSIDNFVEELEAFGLEPDRQCLEDALEQYDDDTLNDIRKELEKLEAGDEPSDAVLQFQLEILACGSEG